MIILAGDIGGTHSRLALLDSKNSSPEVVLINETQLRNADFVQASDLLKTYLSSCKAKPEIACLALAAPIPPADDNNEQNITLTNLPWKFNNAQLAQEFNLSNLCFINDFSGLPYVTDILHTMVAVEDLRILQRGKEPPSPSIEIFVGAGTGLGCVVAHKSRQTTVLNSEAGHSDISGAQKQLRTIIRYLEQNMIPVCWESILSGVGLERLYALVSAQAIGGISAKEITEKASQNVNSNEYQTLELFLTLAGIFSRNMSLSCLPDKLYLVGNIFRIAFDIVPTKPFLQGFHDTTQHRALLKSIPITLISDTQIGLKGAAAYAKQNLC